MIIFNDTSADFVLISVENDHNFEQNEDHATVILKWMDFTKEMNFAIEICWNKTAYILIDFRLRLLEPGKDY